MNNAEQYRRKVNHFNRWLLRLQKLGVPMGKVRILTTTGRLSGQQRRVPVGVLEQDGQQFLIQAYPNAAWVANARADSAAVLSHGRRSPRVDLIELSVDERRPLLRAHMENSPDRVLDHLVKTGLISTPTPDAVAAAADRIAVFRVESA